MRDPRTPKEKIVKEGMDTVADFVGGFLILLVISLPMAYMVHGWEGVAISIVFVAIISFCCLLGDK